MNTKIFREILEAYRRRLSSLYRVPPATRKALALERRENMDTRLFDEILSEYRRYFGSRTATPRTRGCRLSDTDREFWKRMSRQYGEQLAAEFEAWLGD